VTLWNWMTLTIQKTGIRRRHEEGLGVTRTVTLRSGGPQFAEGGVLTALGLVVSEHVDKLALFEPAVRVLEKNVTEDAVSFTLDIAENCPKSLDFLVSVGIR